jgi:DNA invertase Pin-like site-specific DNA recombinase
VRECSLLGSRDVTRLGARGAFIYIRQSIVDQLANNHESRRRQYGLAERARALGWTDVTIMDDDPGRSGSGVSRPGFEKLLAAICGGRVGAVFAIEVSRLARNGRDWHTLIEFCGLVGTVIADEDRTMNHAIQTIGNPAAGGNSCRGAPDL